MIAEAKEDAPFTAHARDVWFFLVDNINNNNSLTSISFDTMRWNCQNKEKMARAANQDQPWRPSALLEFLVHRK